MIETTPNKNKEVQFDLFNNIVKKVWEKEWVDMPEYNNVEKDPPLITLTFKFRNNSDYEEFKEKVKKEIYNGDKFIDGNQGKFNKQSWYPLIEKATNYCYIGENQPRFPIYIISKGRWKNNPTSLMLKQMKVPFKIIVEKEEYQQYAKIIDKKDILILPKQYKEDYDTFWKDGDKRTGSGPARNFAWEHSIKEGYGWHWIVDDNIESFERFNNNMKVRCFSGDPFYILEEFVLRYENIAIGGFAYANFVHWHEFRPPIQFNTRIYSCLLIRNDIPYRWRGRYNEDTDLCIRVLKDGWCTVQTNAFLQGKMATQKIGGGNTDELYQNGTFEKSKMIVEMHPDIVKLTKKFNRWHHHINYKIFKNKPIRKMDLVILNKINNYGMKLIKMGQ